MDARSIPLCVDDTIDYNLEPYGINTIFRGRIVNIDENTISIRWLQEGRQYEIFGDRNWFQDEWKGMLIDYVVDVVSHMAPNVPEKVDLRVKFQD